MKDTINNLRRIKLNTGFKKDAELDVAIVGAGLSGLYSAYRLRTGTTHGKAQPPQKVQIFEMGDRIGGRLESVVLPGMTISGELGGMRYLSSQQIVTQLIEKVFADELTPVKFSMGEAANLLFYLRKQRFRANAWQKAQDNGTTFQTRYYLNDDDQGFSADQLFNKVIYEVLTADPWFVKKYGSTVSQTGYYTYNFTIDARQWDDIKPNLTYCFEGPYKGKKVNDIGFWNLVKDQISEEGYTFLDEAGGYFSNTINWNAAEAFPYMVGDFSNADVTYKTIEGGYDLIAYALAQHYLQSSGAEIWAKNKLLSVKHSTNGKRRYTLRFLNIESGQEYNVFADKVMLAMPRRSLELLDQTGLPFTDKDFNYHLESVIMEPSFKLLMGFEYPWWKSMLGTDSGHSITDLPMRQCYYFGTDPDNSHSLFLSSYNDMRTVTFWKALDDNHEDFEPHATQFTKLKTLTPLKDKASKLMVAEAMSQVRELHGAMQIPEPYVALYKDWADDPYGAGYHAWKAAYNIEETMKYMRNPGKAEQIYICGEAYSDQQGWVEGAFCEAEKILRDHFSFNLPEWLSEKYYLGW
ncbi:flavin monoamine oxidase family protein [Mucilaginibacter lutimaris]|uniref:Tryptophan 2-monooxygenase n=1 Tax=Mucilaginibacter lutimaris TaxID=931629 RepID=A0ABW2ZKT7_9SPHI